jgi:exopolysaccharide production protein ExoZ
MYIKGNIEKMKVLNSLKLLRFVATILVVYNHILYTFIGMPFIFYGAYSVDAFFVLSGFMMAMVIDHNRNLKEFVIGRLTRIIPLYWLTTLIIFSIAFIKPELLKTSTANFEFLFKSLFFIPFFKFETNITPYYVITWTLYIEMYFYIFVGLALVFTARYFPKMNVSLMIALIGGTVYGIAHLLPETYAMVVMLKHAGFIQSLMGLLAYEIIKNFTYDDSAIRKYYKWIIAILIGLMSYFEAKYFEHRLFLLGIPCVITIILLIRLEDDINKLPQWFNKPMIIISDASYAVYLCHIFAFYTLNFILPKGFFHPFAWLMINLVVSLIAGVVVHHLLDLPMTKLLRQKMKTIFMKKARIAS